jgi:hypothetical protein
MARIERRTRVEIICDELVTVDGNRMHEAALADMLEEKRSWPIEETRAAIQRGVSDPTVGLNRTRGWIIVYSGTERVSGGGSVGLYDDVARVLVENWAKERRYLAATVEVTAYSGRRGTGAWGHPDLTLKCNPNDRTRSLETEMLVAFEVETATGFDVRSAYQAYEQGRGTDYSYVVLPKHRMDSPEWARADAVARELGVGLISYGKPGLWSTWDVVYRAPFREPQTSERERFREVALGSGPVDPPEHETFSA